MQNLKLTCFKSYDIRGEIGPELNEEIAYRIGRAYCEFLTPQKVILGSDVRETSESLKKAIAHGLMDGGADVIDIGTCGTEEVYFATWHLDADGGIVITASHNPINFNGMKLVRRGAKPISGDSGLRQIQRIAEKNAFSPGKRKGFYRTESILEAYVDHLLSYIDLHKFKAPLKLVSNPGNGVAGHVIDALEARFGQLSIPVQFTKILHQADGRFPNGVPNPLLPEDRYLTASAVIEHTADMGLAWDGDFDRCFLFDENGSFVEGYYVVGLLATIFLNRYPGEKIIHDPRLIWNTIDVTRKFGGIPVQSKTGHAFIKEKMRLENAIYGGEMSAHHYFRDFAYCDSGMIPWLLIAQILSQTPTKLSALIKEQEQAYPCSGEVNYQIDNGKAILSAIEQHYADQHPMIDYVDGLSLEFKDWRMNLRLSNTEPLLRLNIETRRDKRLLDLKFEEVNKLILYNQ